MSDARLSAPIEALLHLAADDPERVVLVQDGERWTAARVAVESARVASGLARRGVRPRDRVALHLHNTVETARAYLACLRIGAVAVPLNTRLTTPEL